MISLAHGLDLQVVAEGVETYTQLAELTKLGCNQVQGYLFGRAAPLSGLFVTDGRMKQLEAS